MGITVLGNRGQIHIGYVGTLMAEQLRDAQTGIERAGSVVDQLLVGASGIAMAQAVVGHGAGGIFILDLGPYLVNVLLEPSDGGVRGFVVRDKQLMSPFCDSQHLLQFDADAFVDRHRADLAAFALDGDGVLPERLFRDSRVNAEALMNAQSGVPGQAGLSGPKARPRRSGFDLERRGSTKSELSRLRGSERCGACPDDAVDTAAELGCKMIARVL